MRYVTHAYATHIPYKHTLNRNATHISYKHADTHATHILYKHTLIHTPHTYPTNTCYYTRHTHTPHTHRNEVCKEVAALVRNKEQSRIRYNANVVDVGRSFQRRVIFARVLVPDFDAFCVRTKYVACDGHISLAAVHRRHRLLPNQIIESHPTKSTEKISFFGTVHIPKNILKSKNILGKTHLLVFR